MPHFVKIVVTHLVLIIMATILPLITVLKVFHPSFTIDSIGSVPFMHLEVNLESLDSYVEEGIP